jgi:hypothetical protein
MASTQGTARDRSCGGNASVLYMGRGESFARRWAGPTVIAVINGPDEWSAYVARVSRSPGWTPTRLARVSGIAKSSIYKWMTEGASSGLTIDSVYRIADAVGEPRAVALHAAGNLTGTEPDPEVDLIMASNRSDRVKAQMVDRLMARREEERRRRFADLEWMLRDDDRGDGDGDARAAG